MALINFKKGLLASLPSTYAEGTFYVTTDERAIYLDVADDKRIRLGDFQEFADLAALEANANPSTSALYYITDGNILAKWDGAKYVQINVQKTLAELGGVSEATFNALASKVNALEVIGGQANVIETVKVNGTALTVTDKAVDVIVPTGALASKDSVAKTDLTSELSAEIDNKVVKENGKSLISDSEITRLAGMSDGANKVEASETNGSIKIDGVDTVVYTHPDKHAIDDVTGLQDALNAKVNVADYNVDKATFALKSEVESAIGSVHTHDNKDELDLIKSGDVAKWNGEIGTKAIVDANKATWDLAATALQSHQDISHLATEADLTLAEGRIADAEANIVELQKIKVTETSVTDGTNTFTKYDDTTLAARVKTLEDNPYVLPEDVVRDSDLTVYRTSADQDVIDNGIKGRIEVLEAIDHDKLAEDASAAAVAAVLDGAPEKFDTLKEIAAWIADANTAEDAASLVTRVSTIEGDYLKSTDKTELEGKINAKTTAAEVKDQIEAYGYATEADLTLAEGRIKAIEDDYLKGADKTALQAEIDADVKVVSDALEAYKTANNAAVALKANSADVYAKTETFTKDEVNAAIAAAVEAAHTWGTF